MSFLQESHTVSWTFDFWRRNQTFARKVGEHQRKASTNHPKGSKTILGLIGYDRKFVPRFAGIARPLTNLT